MGQIVLGEDKVAEIKQNATRARLEVKTDKDIPGSRDFRKRWFQHGADDVKFAASAWHRNREAAQHATQLRDEAKAVLAQLQRIASTKPAEAAVGESCIYDWEAVLNELARLRAALTTAKSKQRSVQDQQADALRHHKERLAWLESRRDNLRRDVAEVEETVAGMEEAIVDERKRLESVRDSLARLSPLLRTAKREHGI